MLIHSFDSKIIRVDGFNDEDVICDALLDGKLQETFPILNHNKSLILSSAGIYQFTFKSKSFQRSASFKLSLFKEDGAQWLPLSDSYLLLESLPEEVNSPRFLMILCKTKLLQTIEESEEVSEESSLCISNSDEVTPIKRNIDETVSNPHNVQEFFESIDSDILDQSSIKEDDMEKISDISNNQILKNIWEEDNSEDIILNEKSFNVSKENTTYKNALEEMTKKISALRKIQFLQQTRIIELEQLSNKYSEINKNQMKRSEEREEALFILINDKENELKFVQDEIFRIKSDKKSLEFENKRLKDNINNMMAQLNLYEITLKTQEIKLLNKQITELEKISCKSMNSINNLNISDTILAEKDTTIRDLHLKIQKLKLFNCKKYSQESFNLEVDELDDAVKANAKLLNLTESIIRDKEQIYIFRNKKLKLLLHNGILMCRIGSNLKSFKEYMETFILDNTIIKPSNRKKLSEISLDSEYDAQNFYQAQSKLQKASNRFNTFVTHKKKA